MSGVREVRLPALSATMEEATLLSWKVAPGDEVREGQPIAEVATDKVDMELEAPFAGSVVALLVEPGTLVPLGGALATIATEAEDLLGGLDLGGEPAVSPTAPPVETPAAPVPAGRVPSGIVPASPPARKLARTLGVDLTAVRPTGARGQVTPADVRDHAGRVPASAPAPVVAAEPGGDAAKRLTVRRATADIMGASAAIPQFTLYRTLVLDRAAGRRAGRSWTTELVRALAGALRRHPELNARWDEPARTTVGFDAVRIGLAIDRPGVGLVVAAIADPDLADPDDADRMVRTVTDRARTGKPKPEDMAQASVTLSNLGGLGVDSFNALLFPPQAAILSAGSIRMRPVATSDGALKAALTCEVGLTIDHRVSDGADGARFLESFTELVER